MSTDKYRNWPELIAQQHEHAVYPARALRQGENALQYRSGDSELLAIHGNSPYGELPPDSPYALHEVTQAADYHVYEVPPDTLSLEGATFGSGPKGAELVVPLYRKVGSLLGRLATAEGARPPLLGMQDIAYDRAEDTVVVLPPAQFTEAHKFTPEDYYAHMRDDVAKKLAGFWPRDAFASIMSALVQGEQR